MRINKTYRINNLFNAVFWGEAPIKIYGLDYDNKPLLLFKLKNGSLQGFSKFNIIQPQE